MGTGERFGDKRDGEEREMENRGRLTESEMSERRT